MLVGGVLDAFTGLLYIFASAFYRLAAGKCEHAEQKCDYGSKFEGVFFHSSHQLQCICQPSIRTYKYL